MSKLVDRIEQLRTLDAGRKAADEAAYGAIVAAEARGLAWDVDKAAGVLQRLGLDVAKLESDAAIVRRADGLRAEVATAKAARDAAVAEQQSLEVEEKAVQARAQAIAGRRQELRSISTGFIHLKSEVDRYFAANEKLLATVDGIAEGGGK
jgi:hypothetical protein